MMTSFGMSTHTCQPKGACFMSATWDVSCVASSQCSRRCHDVLTCTCKEDLTRFSLQQIQSPQFKATCVSGPFWCGLATDNNQAVFGATVRCEITFTLLPSARSPRLCHTHQRRPVELLLLLLLQLQTPCTRRRGRRR